MKPADILLVGRPGGPVVTLEYYVLALVLEFDSHRGEISNIFAKKAYQVLKIGC